MKLRLFILSLTVFLFSQSKAQSPSTFSIDKSWIKVEAEHLQVYAPDNHKVAANKIARMAELARYDLGLLFDYRPTGKYKILYFPSAEALQYSQLNWKESIRVPGKIDYPRGYGVVVQSENSLDLYQEVRKAMAGLILEEFSNGNRFSTVVQKELLLYESDWFLKGLEAYASTGWTYEDERMLSSVIGEDFVSMAIEGDGPIHEVLRKSIWHFIVHEYGKQKISEIVYLVNISHSIESGVISVLGITLNTLTLRWERYLKSRMQSLTNGRFKLGDYGSSVEIPLPKGYTVAGMDLDASSSKVAVVLNHLGQMEVKWYDLQERVWESTPIHYGYKENEAEKLSYQVPIAWHPSGNKLLAPVWTKGVYQLAQYDFESKELTYRDLPGKISRIFSMEYSHDGNRLVLSALNNGKTDIFIGPSKEGKLKAMTTDGYDNIDPKWSKDDQTIFFASNRPGNGDMSYPSQLNSYANNFDIYQLILTRDTSLVAPITQTPHINERLPQPDRTNDIWYISDRSGIQNLEKTNPYTNKTSPLTNFGQGIEHQVLRKNSLLVSILMEGEQSLFLLGKGQLGEDQYPEPTILRLEEDSRRRILEQKQRLLLEQEEAMKNQEAQEEEEVVQTEPETPIEEAQPKEKKKAVRYYIFDDEEEPYEVRKADRNDLKEERKTKKSRTPTTVFGNTPQPKLEDLKISRARGMDTPWKVDHLGINTFYDPISTFGLKFDMGFSDLSGNHELNATWTPFIRLRVSPRDHIVKADYAYKKNRINFVADAGLTTRYVWIQDVSTSLDSLIFRYNKVFGHVGGRLPLGSKSFVEARTGLFYLDRLDQRLTRLLLLNDRATLLHGNINAAYNNVKEKDGFQLSGLKAEASADYYFALNQGQQDFYRIKADLNYYRPLVENVVLALRLSGAFTTPRSISQFYLGGVPGQLHTPIVFQRREENRINGNTVDTALYAMHFAEFITPMRGFNYNTRAGSRYVVANAELRIPISRLLRYSLQPSSLYNVEIIPFIDAGTVWTEGNPFSQRKPTDTQFITNGNVTIKLQTLKSPFLIGMGTGLRINLLSWSARFDLAWGLDDFTLQSPQLTTSVSKNF